MHIKLQSRLQANWQERRCKRTPCAVSLLKEAIHNLGIHLLSFSSSKSGQLTPLKDLV